MSVGTKTMKILPVITSAITTLVATTAPVAMDTSFILTTEPAKVQIKAQCLIINMHCNLLFMLGMSQSFKIFKKS